MDPNIHGVLHREQNVNSNCCCCCCCYCNGCLDILKENENRKENETLDSLQTHVDPSGYPEKTLTYEYGRRSSVLIHGPSSYGGCPCHSP